MRTFLALLTATTFAMPSIGSAAMTPGDRHRLVAHFEMTEAWLVSEIQGLSPTQLKFRASPESWSVMDVLIDGNMDVYQWFLMISSHSQRHIL